MHMLDDARAHIQREMDTSEIDESTHLASTLRKLPDSRRTVFLQRASTRMRISSALVATKIA